MINQVKQLAHGLLTATLMGCGVTSEVATHNPNAALLVATPVAVADERPTQEPGRPGVPRPVASGTKAMPSAPLAAITTLRPGSGPATPPAEARPEKEPVLAMGSPNRRIQSGRIIDEAGQPLVGATVLLKGTSRGTSTDANGDYSLPVPLGTNTFVVAYIGYQDEIAQSRDGQPLTVTLLPIPGLRPAAPEKPEPQAKPRLTKAHQRKTRH